MLPLKLNKDGKLKLLCLGAHCDDIEIGCGGTILKWIKENKIDEVKWVVLTSTPQRAREATACANFFLAGVQNKEIVIKDFEDSRLPWQVQEVKDYFETLKSYVPDVIFTHCRHDLHQDHRVVNELTWNTFRNHLILEYEILKYDGDLGNPNLFVPLDQDTVKWKTQALLKHYPSQANKQWFDDETFSALMRIRGVESVSRYAEAFFMRKGIV